MSLRHSKYEEEYKKTAEARGILPLIGLTPSEKDSIDRYAISRALIRCGYLWSGGGELLHRFSAESGTNNVRVTHWRRRR